MKASELVRKLNELVNHGSDVQVLFFTHTSDGWSLVYAKEGVVHSETGGHHGADQRP